MPGSLRVRLAVSIGVLACALVACGTDESGEGGTSTPPTGVSGTGAEATPTAGSGPEDGDDTGTASCGPSTSTTPDASGASGTAAPGDSQTHSQDPDDNCVIDSGVPSMPVDP
ncbi:hypothetical protein IAG44_19000 [Streptomyces roseirectus]|uniref:Secreted protein n=1 Tax=Streptomyces roseirectus TaxID=2768066 RepID=A0A7H0IEU8_9ACTN|nr:hypothetical protein [Streptomyces roseirectus]QNP71314.1 hypothetical protein IAG44_19000 [Streptomyces roseirectus]